MLSKDAPTFLSIPRFVVGKPIFRDIRCLAAVIPNALFHENEKPNLLIGN